MEINGETYIKASEANMTTPFKQGQAYLIRTVTMTQTGRVLCERGGFLVLEDAAWVADTGRFMDCLDTGELNEVEPINRGEVLVSIGSIVDAFEWHHDLPRDQK